MCFEEAPLAALVPHVEFLFFAEPHPQRQITISAVVFRRANMVTRLSSDEPLQMAVAIANS